MEKAKNSLIGLIIGILFFSFMVCGFGLFISKSPLRFVLGVLVGTVVSILLSIHLYHTIDVCLDLPPNRANAYMKKGILLRLLGMLVTLALSFLLNKYIHPLGVFIGLMTLKFSVYLQPVIEIMQEKEKKKKQRK
jgi:uncharacterized protein YacL